MSCPEEKPRCALVVGHRESSQGAVSVGGVSEWEFNRLMAESIATAVSDVDIVVVYRDDRGDGEDYNRLPGKINALNPDFVVSMHFNSVDFVATGSEVLHYPGSTDGRRLAQLLLREFVDALGLPNRGLKPRGRNERGGTLLAGTSAPCVLGEPFFGSNRRDWQRASERTDLLARAYARAIRQYALTLPTS